MCPRQGDRHGGEGDPDVLEGSEEGGHRLEEEGDNIDEEVGEVDAGGGVPQTGQQAGQERPEVDGLVVCDVVGLKKETFLV